MRCVGSTTTRSWTRDWPDCCRWTPRWCGRISTRPAHRRIATQGADPNYKNRRAVEPDDHALGRSRGGLSTKIHALTDLLACAVALSLTAGQAGDNPRLVPLLDALAQAGHQPVHLLADKAYSHPSTRRQLRRRRIRNTIPERSDQVKRRKDKGSAGGRPPKFDAELYKRRNTVERGFGRFKQWRGIATRYDKYARTYAGGVLLAATIILARP